MFRRKPASLPKDPSWPADLVKLGYFVNEHAQIRQILKPDERFLYKVTDQERFNQVHKEAFHKCLRKAIYERMNDLGAPAVYLPQLTVKKPDCEPSVPIFATKQDDLMTKKDVIVIVNDNDQDLGVFSYRKICDEGFDAGSSTGIAKEVKLSSTKADSEPGLIIMNPGQMYYSYKEGRALTSESWMALPRKSLFHPEIYACEKYNSVPGSRSIEEHIATVFNKIVDNEQWISKDTNIYIIGICKSAGKTIEFLERHWNKYHDRVKAAAWVDPYIDSESLNPVFETFLQNRTRAWIVDPAPLDTCRGMPSNVPIMLTDDFKPRTWEEQVAHDNLPFNTARYICPTFSGGEAEFTECVFPTAYKSMFAFFEEVKHGRDTYKNSDFEVMPLQMEDVKMDRLEDVTNDIVIREVESEGELAPLLGSSTHAENGKEPELREGEVQIAGVTVEKELLIAAGLA